EALLVDQYPQLPVLIQKYIHEGVKQADIPVMLQDDHKLPKIGLRSIERIIKQHGLITTRHSGLSDVEKGNAILDLSEEDPLGRWGSRKMKEELARTKGVHISRKFIQTFRQIHDPDGSDRRNPHTKKVHTNHLWSSGPNEEWCVDGHEKMLPTMGISVYGVIDKFSRLELRLWALPTARDSLILPGLFLQVAQDIGGIPLTTTSDMGGELGYFIRSTASTILLTIRFGANYMLYSALYLPGLDESIPPHRSTKSIFNITRERAWRPMFHQTFANIIHFYKTGQLDAGFHPDDPVHETIACWIWAKIVQAKLDEIVAQNRVHRVRYQKKSLLPTGGRHIDFYNQPERWGGHNMLVPVPRDVLDDLYSKYARPDLMSFVPNAWEVFCRNAYEQIGSPDLLAKEGWNIFTSIIALVNAG
ncbi:hypothetical protein FISHEDRAFT_44855, partial [Fistulina hepatica ATCC 64428]